jgi:hypothetical protein
MIAKIRVPSVSLHCNRQQDGDGPRDSDRLNANGACHHGWQLPLPLDNRVAGVL